MIRNITQQISLIHKLRMLIRFSKYLPTHMYNDLEEIVSDYYYLSNLSYRLYKKGVDVNEIQ